MQQTNTVANYKDKSADRLACVLINKSDGKISSSKAKSIVSHIDLTSFYEIIILTDEQEAREFLTLTEKKSFNRGQGLQVFYTESGTVIEGQVRLGQQHIKEVDKEIVEKFTSSKVTPSGSLSPFVVVKTRQVFNNNAKDKNTKDTHTDYILGIYIK